MEWLQLSTKRIKTMNFDFEKIVGKIFVDIKRGENIIDFYENNGAQYRMSHHQDCCEDVFIEDICGDLTDLIGHEILLAESVTKDQSSSEPKEGEDSFTWTFYKISTIKGSVTIRWYGSSNGYYSEEVSFECIKEADPVPIKREILWHKEDEKSPPHGEPVLNQDGCICVYLAPRWYIWNESYNSKKYPVAVKLWAEIPTLGLQDA